MDIPDEELDITPFKSGGPGGQKKNVTESSVRVRHIPTGLVVLGTESRSQHRNKAEAIEELKRRLTEHRRRRKRRVPTRPTRASRERRLEQKRRRRLKKQLRRTPARNE
ncbi:MAG TPA: peptide chain release factor-like protein [Candidatus Hydrogenedentes bacterium]|nr:peptide chain release factor-like protein [Candidatus Hydrogenedentota bacterium]